MVRRRLLRNSFARVWLQWALLNHSAKKRARPKGHLPRPPAPDPRPQPPDREVSAVHKRRRLSALEPCGEQLRARLRGSQEVSYFVAFAMKRLVASLLAARILIAA